MKNFYEIINGYKPLAMFTKRLNHRCFTGSKYASDRDWFKNVADYISGILLWTDYIKNFVYSISRDYKSNYFSIYS